jgi:hypothetical protein
VVGMLPLSAGRKVGGVKAGRNLSPTRRHHDLSGGKIYFPWKGLRGVIAGGKGIPSSANVGSHQGRGGENGIRSWQRSAAARPGA